MTASRVAVVFGSESDWPVMEKCVKQLETFGLRPVIEIMSAHRNPERVREFAANAQSSGLEVVIAGAGMSAALAGTLAAHTCVPVIGVPVSTGALGGLDAMLATTQMPPGVPVASVGLDAPGATNAALLAVQILARGDAKLAAAYTTFKAEQAGAVQARNRALLDKLGR
ncbi:MAG: 5-(carboxyamino)imidazole ribonucleotide mutase [Phycisphaerae bacterium]